MAGSVETQGLLGDFEGEPSVSEGGETAELSRKQAHEVAYRFLARYYDFERIAPIRRLLEAISWQGAAAEASAVGELWQVSVQETLGGAPLPEIPPPWES
jgi:hypothetical protein